MRTFGAEKLLAERKWPELSEVEDRLHNAIVPENKARAIDIGKFSDLYGEETITKDQELVERREKEFSRKDGEDPESRNWTRRGELFEAIVNNQIEDSNWLGESASVIVPSRYDDIENGADSIVEFQKGTGRSHLALAIDITKSAKQLDKKFGAIKHSIEGGYLSRVKYFSSHNFRGELRQIPRVVIGADQKTMQEVAELLLRFKTRQKHPSVGKAGEFKETRAALQNHPLKFILFQEIASQLNTFESYARSHGKGGVEIANKYHEAIEILSHVLEEDKEKNPSAIVGAIDKVEADKIYKMILEKTKEFLG